ncbi:MAG: deoxyribonuclease IV [Actinobacteria bacterium]|nr:deoxyribonuclease IV [Actinomycetota bacterium]
MAGPNSRPRAASVVASPVANLRIGAHCSTAGGVQRAIERAAAMGCRSVQIFGTNGRQWKARHHRSEEIAAWEAARATHDVGPVFSHGIYLINLGSTDSRIYAASIRSLIDGLRIAADLKLAGLIFHLGSYGDGAPPAVIARVAQGLRHALDQSPNSVPLLLENSAGSARMLGARFADLAEVLAATGNDERLRVCVDTAHAFAAGSDLRTADGLEALLATVRATVGLERVAALHVNDSAAPCGSQRDRHANLGEGEIGLDGLRLALNHPAFAGLPAMLEVPGFAGDGPDMANMEIARAMLGVGRLTLLGALRRARRQAAGSASQGAASSRGPVDGPSGPAGRRAGHASKPVGAFN